ncbi:family transcriptional regulator, putative [Babesia ovata]|uniref:Family transcriptional regulator, putative n=1 Tax=Babesia ovata TaxID=189622 RepID=A0A2H6KII8_9APIC|nr:family transcriptional regulator, putative [Babesia ovata]GBE62803.1 family transcriptional regulator, putative [Babesia ovata]
MEEASLGVTARRQREKGDDKAAIDVLVEREHPAAAGEQRLDVDEVGCPGGEEMGADAKHVHAVEHRVGDVERGDRPECCDGVEEGRTDAVEVLGDGVVRQPVERVHFLDDDLERRAEILAGALGLWASGGSGEAVGVPVDEAVLEECGRGGVAVHDGGA